MRKISYIFGLISFVFLLSMPVFAQTNLSVQELKEQYKFFNKIANDPNIFWVVELDERQIDRALNRHYDIDLAKGKFVNRAQFEEFVIRELMLEGREYTLQDKIAAMTHHINLSQKVKEDLRNNLLSDLEFMIKERENSANPNTNLNDNTYHPSDTSSFDNVLENMTSDEHLESLNFDNILAQNNGGGTAIQDSQMDSFDGNWDSNWDNAGNDNYSSCPKKKPDNRSLFRAYPNGQTSGNTYRECAYFKSGDLKREVPYVNGKREGLKTAYMWSDKFNVPYISRRINYSDDKRNGLDETYFMSKTGAVYRFRLTTYLDGLQHGDSSQWYDNGQTEKDSKFLNGKIVLQYNYRKDGSFSYCTEWRSDRKPRDCKTGKLRR